MNQSTDSAETPKPSDTNMYACVVSEAYFIGTPMSLEAARHTVFFYGGEVYKLVKVQENN